MIGLLGALWHALASGGVFSLVLLVSLAIPVTMGVILFKLDHQKVEKW